MTTRVRLLQMIVLSMVIALGLTWSMPRLSGQAQPSVALVVDDTASMTEEMSATRDALTAKIALMKSIVPFPTTVIITFKDDVTTRLISNDPVQLQAVVDSLVATGGDDCSESSIAALIRAAQMLSDGGEFNLWTDADSRADGPDKDAILSIIDSKHLTHKYNVSFDCRGGIPLPEAGVGEVSALQSGQSDNHDPAWQSGPARDSRAWTAAALGTGSVLGEESSIETFSTLAREAGGTFVFIHKDSLTTADGRTRYVNASINMMFTTVLPSVVLVTPAAVPQDGAVTVELSGGSTNFQGSSTVSVGGTGVTVLSQSVVSPTRMLVTLAVSGSAAPGFRDVTVTTNLGGGTIETARGRGPLQITTPPTTATIVGITPSQVAQGTTTDVTITGARSHFVNGTSRVSLGSGVTVNSVTVSSATTVTATVTVGAGSSVGFRDVTVTTGTEIAAEAVVGPLLIIAAPVVKPQIVRATPASGSRGKHLSVTLTGENTHFDATTTVGFGGAGISVTSVAVTSSTSLTALISIAPDATLGFRNIVATTGSEVAVLLDGFNTRGGTTLLVETPNGLSRWGLNTRQRLAWTYDGDAAQFQIDISRDGGDSWDFLEVVPNRAGSSQNFYWTVTGPTTATARLGVTAIGDEGATDANDANIRIAPAAIEFVLPHRRTVLQFGTEFRIFWKHNLGARAPVAIEVSADGGTSWRVVTARTETKGSTNSSFRWMVDLLPTANARLRIRALDGSGANAMSEVFRVSAPD